MISYILTDSQIQEAVELLKVSGLDFDRDFDVFLGAYDLGRLCAVGARHGNILKMVAVAEDQQDTGIFAEIMNALVSDALSAGYDHLFVFTKPMYSVSFQYLNFKPLCVTEKVALLEFGRSVGEYVRKWKEFYRPGRNSAIVMNCNPFTCGHRYLVESASEMSDNVYLFVVEEDSSLIPFHARLELVKKGVSHLDNVQVLTTGPYAVSRVTFPSYFIKDKSRVTEEQLKIDLELFCEYMAKPLGITMRFAGDEPVCDTTRMYNDAMRNLLPRCGIEFIELERKSIDGQIISASAVRDMLINGDADGVRSMVPDTTYVYLKENRGKLMSKNATPVLTLDRG